MAEIARELVREMSLLHEDREILLQVEEDAEIIVDAHGGEILVDSTAGVGTEFTDKFPLCMDLNREKEGVVFIREKYENNIV